jgi:DNA-binding transcriptional MerR regulator
MAKKLFYRIGEACKQLDIQPYVLRYWETEFPVLSPKKSRSGQRVYSQEELELIRRIKELLYEEGYTIAGAKKKLESELANGSLGGSGDGAAGGEEVESLDTDAAKRIQQLERGLRSALEEARGILRLLGSE